MNSLLKAIHMGKLLPKISMGLEKVYEIENIVIGSWEEAKQTDSKKGGKDYISMNREGIKNGCIDSKVNLFLSRNSLNLEKTIKSRLRLRRGRSFMEFRSLIKISYMESPIGHQLPLKM